MEGSKAYIFLSRYFFSHIDLMNWYYSELILYFPGILHEPTHRIIRRIMKRRGKKTYVNL